jgi:hypothetical protein
MDEMEKTMGYGIPERRGSGKVDAMCFARFAERYGIEATGRWSPRLHFQKYGEAEVIPVSPYSSYIARIRDSW